MKFEQEKAISNEKLPIFAKYSLTITLPWHRPASITNKLGIIVLWDKISPKHKKF